MSFLYLLLLDVVKVREKVTEPCTGMMALEQPTKSVQIRGFRSDEDPPMFKSDSETNRNSNEFSERD